MYLIQWLKQLIAHLLEMSYIAFADKLQNNTGASW